ncbi:MAG: omega-6 fatty acid desaturase (delta-12 desaturase) [Bacteroidetes bacterium]|nr:MAG: omega-6 fatty acid desaturase (delta-12 desaturase) [Bacteroidota bacterium]
MPQDSRPSLSGKSLILATKPFAKEVRWKSWYYTLSTFFIMLALLAGTVWNYHWSLKIVCSVLGGLTVVRMFVIYHDHQHHAILDKSVPAKWLMTLFGLYILAPTSIWKRSHDYHHKHNSKLFSASIGSYPIVTRKKFLEAAPGEKRLYLVTRHPVMIFGGYISMFFVGMCIDSFRSNPSKHKDSLLALILHLLAGAAIAYFGGWQMLLLTWIIPFTIACGLGAYLFYAQHNFPGVTFRDNQDWSYEGAAIESSSYMKMNPVMRWFTANIGYHHIHHVNSRIPFYRLPEVMDAIPELQQARTTSLNPVEMYRCLMLKIWDPEKGKMIRLNELNSAA